MRESVIDELPAMLEMLSNRPPPTVKRRPAAYKTHYLFRRISGEKSVKSNPLPTEVPDGPQVRHGGSRSGTSQGSRRVQAQMVTARLSRKERNTLLDGKCREAGVRNASGLAAKRMAA